MRKMKPLICEEQIYISLAFRLSKRVAFLQGPLSIGVLLYHNDLPLFVEEWAMLLEGYFLIRLEENIPLYSAFLKQDISF